MTRYNPEGPGIEQFQIVGEATPGEKLVGCGYSMRGTTDCFFQVKFFEVYHVKILKSVNHFFT